jgi:exonuclease V gamma subunit
MKEKPDPVPFYDKNPDNDPEECSVLEIPALARFWRDPAKMYLAAHDIAVEDDEERDEDLDRFPLEPEGLQRWSMKDAIIREIVFGSRDLERVVAELRGRRLIPPGHLAIDLGSLYFRETIDMADDLAMMCGESQPLRVDAWKGGPAVAGTMLLSKDGSHVLVWRPGGLNYDRHYLEPWITCVVAACSGCVLPALVLSEGKPPTECAPIPKAEALIHLENIVRGYMTGQTRPLTYATRLSHEHGKILRAGNSAGREALDKALAAAQWLRSFSPNSSPGSLEPSFRTAWRDRDAYAEHADWERWTRAIAMPLHAWGGF